MVDLDFRLHSVPTLAIQMQTQGCLFVGPDEEEAEVDSSMFACLPRQIVRFSFNRTSSDPVHYEETFSLTRIMHSFCMRDVSA